MRSVKLLLKDKQTVAGTAVEINTREHQEYLLLDSGRQQKIELIDISELEALTPQAKFQKVNF